jgi:hypothetical protein
MNWRSLLTCLALIAGAPAGAEPPALVEQALQTMDEIAVEDWFFTQTTVAGDTTSVLHHDPTRPESQRWTLVSVDGREPTDEEREKADRDRTRDDADDAEDENEGEVRAMVDTESLALIEETASYAVYSFRPVAEDESDAKLFEHVDSTLRVRKAGPYVESLEMRSREPFSPRFGVKVREFAMTMTFAPVGPDEIVLPETVRIRMAARAFLVKQIDETVEVTYSDYRRSTD